MEFPSSQCFGKRDFGFPVDEYGVSAIFDIGSRIGQAGADFSASLNGIVQHFLWSLPLSVPFKQEEDSVRMGGGFGGDKGRQRSGVIGVVVQKDLGLGSLSERLKNHGFSESVCGGGGGTVDEEVGGFNLGSIGHLGRRQ